MISKQISQKQKDLPFGLTVENIGDLLGICRSKAYELVSQPDFPSKRIGNRVVIPRDLFLDWLKKK